MTRPISRMYELMMWNSVFDVFGFWVDTKAQARTPISYYGIGVVILLLPSIPSYK